MHLRIYLDFNTMNQDTWSEEQRVRTNGRGDRTGLHDGESVIVYDKEFEVEVVV